MGVAEVADLLPALRSRVLTASLAGPVGTLAGLGDKGPAVAEAFAEDLGLAAAPIAWHTRRARLACHLLYGSIEALATVTPTRSRQALPAERAESR